MNERIRELAEKASDDIGMVGYHNIPDQYKEKFAELIVKECAELSRSHQDFPETEQTIRRWVAEDIERHFGVE